jgi:hypothetical protein
MLERKTYLLQNHLNPFPISGQLSLSDAGSLAFVLAAAAAGCALGWLEKLLDIQGLKERITSGERVVVFEVPVRQATISWPKSLGGYGMKIDDAQRSWIVTLDYPSGGGIAQIIHMFKGKGTAKPWKEAFAAAGAA